MEHTRKCFRILKWAMVSQRSSKTQLFCRFLTSGCGDNLIEPLPPDSRDHLKRTKDMPRHRSACPASVVCLKDLSPTVKGLTLHIEDAFRNHAEFKAGQWVDMMIPGIETVGGFSICNSPNELREEGLLELAIKFSDHPPAFWVHTKCEVGDEVCLRVGGNFFYHETSNNLLLIAGGVGINPLLSIFKHKRDLYQQNMQGSGQTETVLIYSAKTLNELIFQDEIKDICNTMQAKCHFHITKEKNQGLWPKTQSSIIFDDCKISEHTIKYSMKALPQTTDSYICGPPTFINKIEEYLSNLGFLKQNIFYEKWW